MELDPNTVFLQSSGKFQNRTSSKSEVTEIWNYPVRGHLWKFLFSNYCETSGDFVIVDDRGQIFLFSNKDDVYSLSKKASTPIHCCVFSPLKHSELIIAFEKGPLILYNVETKSSVATFPREDSSLAFKFISCLENYPIIAVGYDQRVELWNIKYVTLRFYIFFTLGYVMTGKCDASIGWKMLVSSLLLTSSVFSRKHTYY